MNQANSMPQEKCQVCNVAARATFTFSKWTSSEKSILNCLTFNEIHIRFT